MSDDTPQGPTDELAIEEARLASLASHEIVDTEPEAPFDGIVKAASLLTQCPIALISLVERDRQWFKAECGFGRKETPRDVSFCQYAVDGRKTIEILDMEVDPRFSDHPFVRGEEGIRYYLGIPIRSMTGDVLGTICVIDRTARGPMPADVMQALDGLATTVEHLLQTRFRERQLRAQVETLAEQSSELVAMEVQPETPIVEPEEEDQAATSSWISRLSRDFVTPEEVSRSHWDVVVNTAVRGLKPAAAKRKLALNIETGLDSVVRPPVIFARVVYSLLNKAVVFSEEGGEIGIEIHRKAGFVLLSVRYRGDATEIEERVARWMRTIGGLLNVERDGDDVTTAFHAWFPIIS